MYITFLKLLSDLTLQSVHLYCIYLQDVALLVLKRPYVEMGFLTELWKSVMITIQYLEMAAQQTARLSLDTCAYLDLI